MIMTSENAENGSVDNQGVKGCLHETEIMAASPLRTRLVKRFRLWRVRLTIAFTLLIIVGGITLIAHDLVTAGMALFFTGFLSLFVIFAIDSFSGDSFYGSSNCDDDSTVVDGFTLVSTFQDGGFERTARRDGTSTPNVISSNQSEGNIRGASVSSTAVCLDQTAIVPDSHETS